MDCATSLPGRYENVLTPMRPNRPHIPSDYTFQRARTPNKQHTRTSGVSAVLPPDYFPATSVTVPSACRSAFPRPFRFGEAVSRPGRPNPQEEKTHRVTIYCQPQVLLGLFAALGRQRPKERAENRAESRQSQANPAPRWVICPPAMVSATPIRPRSCGAKASISPSNSTRSAASPGISRPVSPSICAAQAPPAV